MNNYAEILGFIAGIIITAVGLIISIIFIPKYLWDDNKILSICNIILAIGVIATAYFSQVALNNQRTQWLNDTFIKHEADVLLEFRIAYGDAQEAIHFFFNNVLNPIQKMDASIKVPPNIKRKTLIKYYNDINHLNNLYNKNQYIFRKHGLEDSISCLTCLLDAVAFLPDSDLEFRLVREDNVTKNYQLVEWNKIERSFVFSAAVLFNPPKNVTDLIQLQKKDMNKEFDRLKSLVSDKLNSLTFKLDELTLYMDSKNKKNMEVRQSKFYSDLLK